MEQPWYFVYHDALKFNLQSRRFNGRPMQPSVYIHQGQKVLITQ